MIRIEQNQNIYGSENLRVATPTGDYDDNALIEFYDIATPSIVVGAFQAQYVKYGSMVYTFNGHMELGSAILKIDPESTHSSASYVRMSRDLANQMSGGSLESTSLDEVIDAEKKNIEEQSKKVEEVVEKLPEEAPPQENLVETPAEPALPEVPVEEAVVPVPEEVSPEVPEEISIETPAVPEVVVPPTEVPGEVLGETIVVPPVAEEVIPESVMPTVEEVLNEVIPDIESVLPEPVARIIRKAKAKKKKLA